MSDHTQESDDLQQIDNVAGDINRSRLLYYVFTTVTIHLGRSGFRGDTTICPVCLDDIADTDLTYRHESCGIAFNYYCLQEHLISSTVRKEELKCPMCREVLVYDPNLQLFSPSPSPTPSPSTSPPPPPPAPPSSLASDPGLDVDFDPGAKSDSSSDSDGGVPLPVNAPRSWRLTSEWHDVIRIDNGEVPFDCRELSEQMIRIVRRVLQLAPANNISPTACLIQHYARICDIVNVIENEERRQFKRGELMEAMNSIYVMNNEGELDSDEMDLLYGDVTLAETERVAQLMLQRRIRLNRIMGFMISIWRVQIEAELATEP